MLRNRLQYAYSISVFLGVLATSYLMLKRDGNGRLFEAMQSPGDSFRSEASLLDPGVSNLLDIEKALSQHNEETETDTSTQE